MKYLLPGCCFLTTVDRQGFTLGFCRYISPSPRVLSRKLRDRSVHSEALIKTWCYHAACAMLICCPWIELNNDRIKRYRFPVTTAIKLSMTFIRYLCMTHQHSLKDFIYISFIIDLVMPKTPFRHCNKNTTTSLSCIWVCGEISFCWNNMCLMLHSIIYCSTLLSVCQDYDMCYKLWRIYMLIFNLLSKLQFP